MSAATDPADWLGREVADAGGTRYARVDDVFVGERSGRPEFGIVTVGRAGGNGSKRVAVPMRDASMIGDVVVLAVEAARVRAAPEVEGDVSNIPPHEGRRILDFFGLADEAPTAPMPPITPQADTVLSEEQLDVTTEARAAERVRVRKQVVTEEVTVTVTVRREELVIEREPIAGDGVDAPEDGAFEEAAETVFVLHAEEPVVGRRVVPVERVRLRKDMVLERTSITEPVRKERAAVDHIDHHEENQT